MQCFVLFIVRKPSQVSHEEAAAIVGDAVRAYTALYYHARICAGDTVLILDGATSPGSIAVQLAKLWGAKVIVHIKDSLKILNIHILLVVLLVL